VKWTVHGERTVYDSPWVRVALVDVEVPGAARFEHHVVRSISPAVGVVVTDAEQRVLLLWRHRFMTDEWGWEIPAGSVDHGEDLAAAAAREVLEESGWQPGPLTHWLRWHPQSGKSDQVFEVFGADSATYVGEPSDPSEAERVEWVPLDQVPALIRDGQIHDGMTITALLWQRTPGGALERSSA
jgi:8-oxo-dGTP pyrophosphatase MutT (NUDIX family)